METLTKESSKPFAIKQPDPEKLFEDYQALCIERACLWSGVDHDIITLETVGPAIQSMTSRLIHLRNYFDDNSSIFD
ncbi:MAG TPA: hypothetical protein VJL83_00980 [Patescibacteria group bacterium]|nr:hypothetical protein [Patescibacteria group bacterium]